MSSTRVVPEPDSIQLSDINWRIPIDLEQVHPEQEQMEVGRGCHVTPLIGLSVFILIGSLISCILGPILASRA